MCLVVIKKSKHPSFSYFTAMNREEKYDREWSEIGPHWSWLPGVLGYKDSASGGSWFAYNQHVVAILINRESDGFEHLSSRSGLVLQALRNAKTLTDAINNLTGIGAGRIKPFNIILMDGHKIVWGTNWQNADVRNEIFFEELNDDLVLVNRSFPNDFKETRVALSFKKFNQLQEPVGDNGKCWADFLTTSSYTMEPSTELTPWLVSDKWGTLSSDIIYFSKQTVQPISVVHIKKRTEQPS